MVKVDPPSKYQGVVGKALMDGVVTPEIKEFSSWFSDKTGSSLTPMEMEVLKTFLYYLLVGKRPSGEAGESV